MNILSLLAELSIPCKSSGQHQHVRQGWVGVDCPWCGKSTGRYHLGINVQRGYANCWKCGSKRLGDVLSEITGRPMGECLRMLGEIGWDLARPPLATRGKLKIPIGVGPLQPVHRRYLKRRGFDPDVVASLWGVKGIGLDPKLSWRLFIPITTNGDVVSWTTRAIGDKGTRYITAEPSDESTPAKSVLYGTDIARHAIIICEGPLDAWAIGPGGVATLGLAYSKEQLFEMSRFPIRIVCFDSESAAQGRARVLAKALKYMDGETYQTELRSAKDAADALLNDSGRGELEELRSRFLQ